MKASLTGTRIAALRPQAKAYYVSDDRQVGLRLRVSPSGSKTWNLVYRIKGVSRVRSVSLGPCDPSGRSGLGLAEARNRAAEIVKAARQARDLLEEEALSREVASNRLPIGQLVDNYAKWVRSDHRPGGPLRTAIELERRLRRTLRDVQSLPAEELKRRDIRKLLDPVAEQGHLREAEKRRQALHAMFRWAVAEDYIESNPVSGLASYGSGVVRTRVLSAEEIVALWNWLEKGAQGMPDACRAVLQLQLCLGARCGEISGIEASEIRERDGHLLWVLPSSRSKNKAERTTPIVGLAKNIVNSALHDVSSGPLFKTVHSDRALTSSDVGHALLKRRKALPIEHFTSHDLRRTVVSKMDEMGITLDVIAAVIGHQRGQAEVRTLIRHYSHTVLTERKVQALTAWDLALQQIIAGGGERRADNVLQLQR